MALRMLRSIIIGPPGSGKGTISSRIIKDFHVEHLSSGDVLRYHLNNKTSISGQIASYIHEGILVPDDLMVKLIHEKLVLIEDKSVLLDGFPRTVSQALALESELPTNVVINLHVPFEVIVDRIKGRWMHPGSGRVYHTQFNPPKIEGKDDVTGEPLIQRDDDKEDTVRRRLECYHELTEPVLDFYKKEGLLKEFRGTESNEIWPHVHEYLATKVQPLQFTQYG